MAAPEVALAEGPAIEAGQKLSDKAFSLLKSFEDDPVRATGRLCRLVGAICAIGGGLAYVGSISTARLEQQYKNDIDNRLGLPNGPSPTPPSPKQVAAQDQTLSWWQQAVQVAVGSVYNIDLTNAQITGQKMIDAYNAMTSLANQLTSQNATPPAISGAVLAAQQFSLAAQQLGWWPPGTSVTVAPTNPESSPTSLTYTVWTYDTAKAVQWTTAEDWVWTACNAVNQIAAALNQPIPFNVPAVPPGSPPPPKPASSNGGSFGWLGGFFSAAGAAILNAAGAVVAAAEQAGSYVQQAVADAQQIGSDVGAGIAFLGKMLLNLPMLIWDGLGYAVSWGANTLFSDLWQPLLILGAGLIGVSIFCLDLYPRLKSRAALQVARAEKKIADATMPPAQTEAAIAEVAEEASREARIAAATAPPAPVEAAAATSVAAPGPSETASPIPAPPEPAPATPPPLPTETSHETPPLSAPERPLPVGTPTSEVERELGEPAHVAPTEEEVRKMIAEAEANRLASMPAPRPRKPKVRGRDWARMASDAFGGATTAT